MQYKVLFGIAPDLHQNGFVLWVLTKQSLGIILRYWPAFVTWQPVVPQTFASCRRCIYHPTAITRRSPPAPIRAFLTAAEAAKPHRRVLYHGVGRDDVGARALTLRGDVRLYDPYHPSPLVRKAPEGQFDEIHSVYVLCVVDIETGRHILSTIFHWLSPTGIAVVSVRR